jgi:hypothetical protein
MLFMSSIGSSRFNLIPISSNDCKRPPKSNEAAEYLKRGNRVQYRAVGLETLPLHETVVRKR